MAFLKERVGRVEKGMKTGEGGRLVGGRVGVVRRFVGEWEGEMRRVGVGVKGVGGGLVRMIGEGGVERVGRWKEGVFVEGTGEERGEGEGEVGVGGGVEEGYGDPARQLMEAAGEIG